MASVARVAPSGRTRLLGVLGAVLAVAIWGGWFPVVRLGIVTGEVSAWDMVFLRFSAGALILFPVVLKNGFKAGEAGWAGTAVFSVSVSLLFPFLIGVGIAHAPAAHSAIFVPGTFPALVFILGVIFLRDPPSPKRLLGLFAILAGIALIGSVAFANAAPGALTGYLAFHGCAWLWAVYTVVARVARISTWHAVAITNVGAAILFMPFYLFFVPDKPLFDLAWPALLFQVTYQGVLGSLVAMLLYNNAINILGAAEAAAFIALVPCVAALLAVPILGEALGWQEIAALVSVTIGIMLVAGARLPGMRRS